MNKLDRLEIRCELASDRIDSYDTVEYLCRDALRCLQGKVLFQDDKDIRKRLRALVAEAKQMQKAYRTVLDDTWEEYLVAERDLKDKDVAK